MENVKTQPLSFIETLSFDGRERTARVYVPLATATGPRVPLLISMHGGGGRGVDQQRSTGYDSVADEFGFVAAYPDGVGNTWNDGRGLASFVAHREGVDDVGFLIALIDHLAATRNVDPARVYATGISNGGLMALRLACERSDRIAGIGVVARSITRKLSEQCGPGTPVPAMFIHGTGDPIVPFDGGDQKMGGSETVPVLSAQETARFWARRNGASENPKKTSVADVVPEDGLPGGYRLDYSGATPLQRVSLVALTDAGHTWPLGHSRHRPNRVGRVSLDFDASRELWAFFSNQMTL